jgi:polyisoprenoid-binding protein YceI
MKDIFVARIGWGKARGGLRGEVFVLKRTAKTLLLSAGIGGVVSLLVFVGLEGIGEPGVSVWVSPARTAVAQGPGVALRYLVVAEGSEARYRVREQLAGLSFPNDAVGTTSVIEGSLALDAQGRVLPGDSRFAVDLRTLRSDEARRDNYLRRNTLETDQYPHAVFVPTEVRGLPVPLPQAGTVSFNLVGDLTIRDATRRVTWEATATVNSQEVSIRPRTAFRFADFGLRIPRVASVLSVEDNIRLEIDLLLRRIP